MRKLLLFVSITILPFLGKSQVLTDFETAETSPAFTAEGATAVVDNPDKSGINTSDKVGYYNKIAGDWHYVSINFDHKVQVGYNNTLTFKIHASTEGRIYAKFWNGDTVLIEHWAPTYEFMPTPDTWVECTMDLTDAMGMEFTMLQLAACVNNEDTADVYFDDVELSNPEMGDGRPKVLFSASKTKVQVGDTINFDATASFDYDGTITSYTWDFGDGSTATGITCSHTFTQAQNASVKLTLTDNDGKIAADSTLIFVFDTNQNISDLYMVTKNLTVNDKVELLFQLDKNYNNVYDPDEVTIDATVDLPDGSNMVVPCFYFIKSHLIGTNWTIDSSYQGWMLRFSSPQPGDHKVFIRVTDAEGVYNSDTLSIHIGSSDTEGIIRCDKNNHQYYRHETGEPFFPMGINIGWNYTDTYTKIIKNLSAGKANIYRYWQTPFAQQALEWKKTGFYNGLGRYSQMAAAMTDSLINLNEATNMYMQLVIFQHGMFSENVDAMWADNPYNTVNGGYVDRAEEYFYNDACKAQTKKLLRYIVARWGYSKNLFAWEFFNEVQFTGIHNSQTSQWFPAVVKWHSEMSRYVQSIDPFNHIMTTSAEHNQLASFDTIAAMDNIQYHLYSNTLLDQQTDLDFQFRNDLKNLSIINGEFGTNVDADVPMDMQRNSIWNSIMTQVPHYMWVWEHYEDTAWANLYKMPGEYIQDEDFGRSTNLQNFDFEVQHATKTFKTMGLTNGTDFYGFLYDELNGNDISGATLILKDLPYSNYKITWYLPSDGQTMVVDSIPLIKMTNKIAMPDFSKGLAFKIKFQSDYIYPISIAGNDTIMPPGITLKLSGAKSFSQVSNTTLTYLWNIDEKPATSKAEIENVTAENTIITPDVSGSYSISLVVNDGFHNSEPDVIHVTVSNPPVAVAGNDTIIDDSKNYFYIDGSKSYDTDGDALTYKWELLTWPAESRGNLLNIDQPEAILPLDGIGKFVAKLVVSDGVSESQPDTVTITVWPTDIVDKKDCDRVKIYPNPTRNKLILSSDENISKVEFYDFGGKLVFVQDIPNMTKMVELNLHNYNLTKGLFMAKIFVGNKVEVRKIIYSNR